MYLGINASWDNGYMYTAAYRSRYPGTNYHTVDYAYMYQY